MQTPSDSGGKYAAIHISKGVWTAYGSLQAAAKAPDAAYFEDWLPADIGDHLDDAKQRCIYTEFENGRFEDPVSFERAHPGLWPWLIGMLDNRLTSFRALHGELGLSQKMMADYLRQLDPATRTEDDNQQIARVRALGVDYP